MWIMNKPTREATERASRHAVREPMEAAERRPRLAPRPQALMRLVACLVLVAAISCFGCGGNDAPKQAAEGITVTDCAGREVVVPDEVDSIACLYAYSGHVCVLLGCEDKISAVVQGLKRDHLMERKVEGLADIPSPYNKGAINVEELLAVGPDLVFLRKDVLQNSGELEKLDATGIPYLVVDYETADDQVRSIEMMGESLGCSERAKAYTEYYRSTFDMVRERVARVPESERKTVFHSINEAVRTDIPGTLSYEVLDAAGCKNVVSSADELKLDGDKGNATVEQIYVWDPDVILVNEPTATEYFLTDAKFSGLRAVREGRVYQLPVGISRWAHPGSVESPIAALYIAKLLYPEQFEDIDMAEETRDFYKRFFDIDLSDEDVESILSGVGMRAAREGSAA